MIVPGQLGVDYSFARPSPAALAAVGVSFVSRYISASSVNPKNVTRTEVDALHAVGIGVLLNFEQSTGDALGGAPAGERNARIAAQWCRDLGAPALPVIFSCDVAPQQRATLAAYYEATDRVMLDATGELSGLYAGIDAIGWADADGFAPGFRWQATAWSTVVRRTPAAALAAAEARWPGGHYLLNENFTNPTAVAVHPATHALQHYGRVEPPLAPITDAVDENRAFRPFVAWAPTATPTEDIVLTLISIHGDPAWFVGEQTVPPDGRPVVFTAWHVQTEPELSDWRARGLPVLVLERGDMGGVRLLGDIPPGWGSADFRQVAGDRGPAGPPGMPGASGPAGPAGPAGPKGDGAFLTVGTRLIVQ